MNLLDALSAGLAALEQILAILKLNTDTPTDLIQDVEAAIAAYKKVHGSPVTLGQVEGMRLNQEF
jgi:N-methylhydantoinase B/oxoprolinase/acetone carboxylase alpha subunit